MNWMLGRLLYRISTAAKQFLLKTRCPRLVVLSVSQTYVTTDGVALFVACHPNAVKVEHEESFWALSLVRRKAQQVC